MREIEEENDEYENLVLREKAVEMISNWRFWKYFDKSSELDSIRSKANNIVAKLIAICKGHQEFSYYFSQIQDRTISWKRSNEQEFCIRKKLVELNFVNPRIYNFKENPKNARENINCDEIFQNVKDELFKEFENEKKLSQCALEIYRKNNYAENVLKIELFSKLSLSASDRTKEKQDFINTMVDITYDAKEC